MYFSLYFRNQQANQGDNSPTLMLEVLGNGHSNGKSSSETRRATEDRLAVIFLVIILAFIFCHLPRVSNIFFRLFPIISIAQKFFSIFFLKLEKIVIDEKVICYHNISN